MPSMPVTIICSTTSDGLLLIVSFIGDVDDNGLWIGLVKHQRNWFPCESYEGSRKR
eukprot:c44415_g1_i1 orf=59-226(+)